MGGTDALISYFECPCFEENSQDVFELQTKITVCFQ